jgi:hypothetical protein
MLEACSPSPIQAEISRAPDDEVLKPGPGAAGVAAQR